MTIEACEKCGHECGEYDKKKTFKGEQGCNLCITPCDICNNDVFTEECTPNKITYSPRQRGLICSSCVTVDDL